jgi:hypothetical protein
MSEFDDLLAASVAEIEAALRDPEREDGEVTVEEYAAQQNISIPQARRDLERGILVERLSKRKLKIGRAWKVIYKVVK